MPRVPGLTVRGRGSVVRGARLSTRQKSGASPQGPPLLSRCSGPVGLRRVLRHGPGARDRRNFAETGACLLALDGAGPHEVGPGDRSGGGMTARSPTSVAPTGSRGARGAARPAREGAVALSAAHRRRLEPLLQRLFERLGRDVGARRLHAPTPPNGSSARSTSASSRRVTSPRRRAWRAACLRTSGERFSLAQSLSVGRGVATGTDGHDGVARQRPALLGRSARNGPFTTAGR
jgi:hypothetical protein